jgi:hypothetical protein
VSSSRVVPTAAPLHASVSTSPRAPSQGGVGPSASVFRCLPRRRQRAYNSCAARGYVQAGRIVHHRSRATTERMKPSPAPQHRRARTTAVARVDVSRPECILTVASRVQVRTAAHTFRETRSSRDLTWAGQCCVGSELKQRATGSDGTGGGPARRWQRSSNGGAPKPIPKRRARGGDPTAPWGSSTRW